MLNIGVTGFRTSIVRCVAEMLNAEARNIRAEVEAGNFRPNAYCTYVLAAGVLWGKAASDQFLSEIEVCAKINLVEPIYLIEQVLGANPLARIVVIGSGSAELGSFDMVYAATKAGLHGYVKNRKVTSRQSLVCIAPPIISDAGMTLRRDDYPSVLQVRRTVTTKDVCEVVVRALQDNEFVGHNMVMPL